MGIKVLVWIFFIMLVVKNVFLSIDSRITEHNPLYQAWKIKSFTDGDITFHFIIMDILESAKESLSIHEITKQVDQYLSVFESPKVFDESITVFVLCWCDV